jgi:hypothetical protein
LIHLLKCGECLDEERFGLLIRLLLEQSDSTFEEVGGISQRPITDITARGKDDDEYGEETLSSHHR